MDSVDLLLRWMHIFAAVTLAGGTYFLYYVWFPATRSASLEDREAMFGGMRKSWAMCVMVTTLLLLVSGIINAVSNIRTYELAPLYHALVAAKLLIGLVIFFLSARIAGRSASAVKFREKMGTWLLVNTVLASLLIGIGGYMRSMDRPLKVRDEIVLADQWNPPHPHSYDSESDMDKKAKKKIDVLRQRIHKLQQQLSGARQQDDEPGEVDRLEKEIAECHSEIEKLKTA